MRLPFFGESDARSEDEKALAHKMEELYSIADGVRRGFETEWYSNILYLQGRMTNDALAGDLRMFSRVIPQLSEALSEPCINNQVYPLVRAASTGFRDFAARHKALPATEDEDDKAAAELATDFLQWRLTEDKEKTVRFNEVLWLLVTGRVLRKVWWDPEAEGTTPNGRRWGVGDIKTDFLNVWQFHQSPWVDSGGQIPWIIESDVRDIDEINDLFPGHDVKEEEFAQVVWYRDQLLTSSMGGVTATSKRNRAAILKQFYHRPTPKYPQGRYIVWANQKVLSDEQPLPDGEFPFVPIDWFTIPGIVYPMSFVSPLKQLQKEGHTTLNQWIELKNRQVRGDIAIRGGDVPSQEVLEDGRKVLRMDMMTQEFEFVKYDLDPRQAIELVGYMWEQMKSAAGVHEPSLGETSGGTPTAFHIATLKEADQSGIGMFRSGIDYQRSLIERLKIILGRSHYKVARMLRVVGRKEQVKTAAFFGSDLRGTEDVIAVPVPWVSQAQKMQMQAEAGAAGLYGEYETTGDMYAKLTVLRQSGIPEVEDEVDDICARMGLTWEDLGEIVGKMRYERAQTEMVAILAAKMQAVATIAMIQQGPQASSPAMGPGAEGQPTQQQVAA